MKAKLRNYLVVSPMGKVTYLKNLELTENDKNKLQNKLKDSKIDFSKVLLQLVVASNEDLEQLLISKRYSVVPPGTEVEIIAEGDYVYDIIRKGPIDSIVRSPKILDKIKALKDEGVKILKRDVLNLYKKQITENFETAKENLKKDFPEYSEQLELMEKTTLLDFVDVLATKEAEKNFNMLLQNNPKYLLQIFLAEGLISKFECLDLFLQELLQRKALDVDIKIPVLLDEDWELMIPLKELTIA